VLPRSAVSPTQISVETIRKGLRRGAWIGERAQHRRGQQHEQHRGADGEREVGVCPALVVDHPEREVERDDGEAEDGAAEVVDRPGHHRPARRGVGTIGCGVGDDASVHLVAPNRILTVVLTHFTPLHDSHRQRALRAAVFSLRAVHGQETTRFDLFLAGMSFQGRITQS